ncbi:caspase family protein [Flammeovirga aprica]|uniref:Caspase family protein n=1 Tax=Flammeovirga aprica JL-4 TaxID=694437 RepID=A0A7X9XBL8_9BACT|nr:caspase family protein [Flammeovirga aprica]NME70754.1 caspase family protein [Flammeovirga aprica JL-4]
MIRCLLYFLIAIPLNIFAQNNGSEYTRGMKIVSKSESVINKSQKYALIIGSNTYNAPSWSQLNNAEYDAESVYNTLNERYDFECQLLKSPTKKELQQVFLSYHEVLKENDRFLIYVAGHGDYDSKYSKDGFIVFKDSKAVKEDRLHETYLSYGTFKDWLDALPAKHVALVLDVCFGGAFNENLAKSRSRTGVYFEKTADDFIVQKLKHPTRVYLTSGALTPVMDGKKGRLSPFCTRFIEALTGGITSEFPITLSSIYQYLNKNISEAVYGKFGKNYPTSEFIFGFAHGMSTEEKPTYIDTKKATVSTSPKTKNKEGLAIAFNTNTDLFGEEYTAFLPKLKSEMSTYKCYFPEDKSNAFYTINIQATTREYNNPYGNYFSYVDIEISIKETYSNNEVYSNVIHKKGGSRKNYQVAGQEAYNELAEELGQLFKQVIINN